jgi:PTH1 family peptidyl-tRNA hydrolase
LEALDRIDVPRLRFGIGRPDGPIETRDFVLAGFTDVEERALDGHLERAGEALESFLVDGIVGAMNRYNAV